ncbi:MAG: hypothetical protein ACLGHO_05750 [Gammaproteobacteria bacterium]
MWRELKQSVRELVHDEPGRRFARFYKRRKRDDEHYVTSVLYIAAGIAVVIVGIVLAISPIVPGFFLVIGGLAIIVARARPVAYGLDRMELWLRRLLRRRPS